MLLAWSILYMKSFVLDFIKTWMEKGGAILELTDTFKNQVVCIRQPDLILYYLIFPSDSWKVYFFTQTQDLPLSPHT